MLSSPGDRDLFQKYKQQTYRLAYPFGVIVTILYTIIVAPDGSIQFWLGISMSIMLFLLSIMVWGSTQYLSVIEFTFYFVVMTYFFILTQLSIASVMSQEVLAPSDLADPLNSLALWLVIFMLAGFLTLIPSQARALIAYAFFGATVLCVNNLWELGMDGALTPPMMFRWVNPMAGMFITLLLLQRMGILQQRRATTDALTGLMNRHALYAVLEQEIERSNRYGYIFSIILFDLDHFKRINDTLGHMAGDTILVETSARVTRMIRKTDFLGRWGGEEFLLILPGTHLVEATALAERIRLMLIGTRPGRGQTITASFGVTEYLPGAKLSSMLQRVDAALYSAKHNGRNQVFDLPMSAEK